MTLGSVWYCVRVSNNSEALRRGGCLSYALILKLFVFFTYIYSHVSIVQRLLYYYFYLSCQFSWPSEDDIRDALIDNREPPVRVFALTNESREGNTGEVLLGIKRIICQLRMSVFYWTILIQFLPKNLIFYTHSLYVLERCLNY